jgi:hypothetical protein
VEDDDDDVMMGIMQTMERSEQNGGLENPRRILAIITSFDDVLLGQTRSTIYVVNDVEGIVEGGAVCNSLIIEEVRGSM